MDLTVKSVGSSKSSSDQKIRTRGDLVKALIKLERTGRPLKGSGIEGDVRRFAGGKNFPDAHLALGWLKGESVRQKEVEVSKFLSRNSPSNERRIRKSVEDIFLDREFLTADKQTRLLSEELGDNNSDLTAKETVLSINRWKKDNLDSVVEYKKDQRIEDYKRKIQELNPEITDSKLELVGERARDIVEVSYSEQTESQREGIINKFNNISDKKLELAWFGSSIAVGIKNMSVSGFEGLVSRDRKRKEQLSGVNLPYDGFPEMMAFDELMGKFDSYGRDKIRGGDFMENSVGLIVENGLSSGLESMVTGFNGGGNFTIDGGSSSGNNLDGLVSMGGSLLSSLKGGLGNLGVGAANLAKKGAAAAVNRGLIALGSGLAGAGTALSGMLAAMMGPIGWGLLILLGSIGLVAGLSMYNSSTYIAPQVSGENIKEVVSTNTNSLSISSSGGGSGSGITTIDMNPVSQKDFIVSCDSDMTIYQNELMAKVNAAGYRTRAGVVAAAYYLAAEFPYRVPYFWSGGHSWRGDFDDNGGFPYDNKSDWGCIKQQPSGKPKAAFGLDCSGFVDWSYLTAGFKDVEGGGDPEYRYSGGNIERRYFNEKNCEYIKANIKPGDVLKKFEGGAHTGIIVQISGNKVKYAQSSGSRGVNIEFVDICTGQKIDGSKNSFEAVDLMDKYFNKFGAK